MPSISGMRISVRMTANCFTLADQFQGRVWRSPRTPNRSVDPMSARMPASRPGVIVDDQDQGDSRR